MRVVVGFVMVSVTGVLYLVPVIQEPTSSPDYVPTDHNEQEIISSSGAGWGCGNKALKSWIINKQIRAIYSKNKANILAISRT